MSDARSPKPDPPVRPIPQVRSICTAKPRPLAWRPLFSTPTAPPEPPKN